MSTETCYIVCHDCKLGKTDTENNKFVVAFTEKHGIHKFELVPEAIFLSDLLAKGYKDVDRPDLKPIGLTIGTKSSGSIGKAPPFGAPEPKTAQTAARQPAFGQRRMDGIASLAAEEAVSEKTPQISDTFGPFRPCWEHYFMAICDVVKTRGTCSRLKVGAVVVDTDQMIVSTGYNGAPRGLEHCSHGTDGMMQTDKGHCVTAEHAERNALLYADRSRARGGTLYITVAPCLTCCRMAVTMGIKKIVYRSEYKTGPAVPELCERAGIVLVCLES